MQDPTRTISYIEEDEDPLDAEIELDLKSTMEENLIRYMKLIASLAAMSGINIYELPKDTRIYYIDENGEEELIK